MSRIDERAPFDVEARLRLLEGDMDRDDGEKTRLANSINGLRSVLVGILIAMTTIAVGVAGNILVRSAGGG